jgi:DNA repair exonuclease SbcCD nuclease subunit
MTKFIYLADSHYGSNPPGYQQQHACPERLPEIIDTLKKYIANENIDFVLHGGDLIDFTSEENIRGGADLFDALNVPVYLCLGNHDLTTPDALSQWIRFAPQLFPDGKPEFSILHEDCALHVAPNHWGDYSYYWNVDQRMSFYSAQQEFLETALSANTMRPHILLTHGPTFGLPPQQTGFDEEYHAPNKEFTQIMIDIAARHPHLRCVLGAHNHLNMCRHHNETYFVTTSAFVETPFEVKLFEVTREAVSMATITLGNRMSEKNDYDFDKTFVQGRSVDRGFIWNRE